MSRENVQRPTVLVVDSDPAMRRLLRLGLEVDGARVLESSSPAQARELLSAKGGADLVCGVVVAADLPRHGAAAVHDEVDRLLPDVPVVTTVAPDDGVVTGLEERSPHVLRGDVEAVITALRLPSELREATRPVAADLLENEADSLAEAWRELCHWDPLLGPEADPPMAEVVIRAVATAITRPQPLGWGPDPDVERVAELFAMAVPAVESAVGQFVCLRETLRRRLVGSLPPEEEAETLDRLHMIVDRAMGVAVSHIAQRLEQQAYVDPLTGLLNRRALERDLRREIGRATRYRRRFTVVLADLDGLKIVNDREGHAAGDARLRALARAVETALRVGDAGYRIGGDEFVLLLPEITEATTDAVLRRVREAGAPPFSWGAATFPDDGGDIDTLLRRGDERLMQRKAAR
jgi:diguanylate cyclase (GGDEF)-like protein